MSDAALLLSHFVESTRCGKPFSSSGKDSVWVYERHTMIRSRCPVYHALNSGFDNSEVSPCPTDSFSDTEDDQASSVLSGDSLEDISCSSKMALVTGRSQNGSCRHAKSKSVHITSSNAAAIVEGFVFAAKPPSGRSSSSERSTTPASSSSSSSGKCVNYVKIAKQPLSHPLSSPNSRTETDFGRINVDKCRTLPARCGSSEVLHSIDILGITPDIIAEQLTLMDFHLYQAIREEELLSCGWADQKYKHTKAPNIMNFIDRFNQTAYWITVEILERDTAEMRAKVISHFLKVCRQLKTLQNLNSEAAVVSALRNAAVFRLSRTWAAVSAKEKSMLTKRSEFLLEKEKFRTFLEETEPPCIPFLGPFLTELITVKEAYRDKSMKSNATSKNGETNAESRKRKMEEVLRGVLRFQCGCYDRLKPVLTIQKYINSRKYIDALVKFTEEEQYKRSLALEPLNAGDSPTKTKRRATDGNCAIGSPVRPNEHNYRACAGSCPQNRGTIGMSCEPAESSLSPLPKGLNGGSRPNSARMHGGKFPFTHRKALSLGTNIFRDPANSVPSTVPTPKNVQPVNLLDDSLPSVAVPAIAEVLERSESPTSSENPSTEKGSNGDCFAGGDADPDRPVTPSSSATLDRKTASLASRKIANPSTSGNSCCSGSHELWFGSIVQRKTLRKNHKRVRWTSVKDFWMELRGCRLFLYYRRLMGNRYRRHGYCMEPWKVFSVVGTKVTAGSPNSFTLSNIDAGCEWHFCVGTPETTEEWIRHLRRAAIPCDIPENLMEFT